MTTDNPTYNGRKRNGHTGKPFVRSNKADRDPGPRDERNESPRGKRNEGPRRERNEGPRGERFAGKSGASGAGRPFEKRAAGKPSGKPSGKPFSKDRDGGARVMRRKPAGADVAPAPSAHEGERIAKVIARAGLCSRRDAEIMIEAGRVSVNGRKLQSAAFNVTDKDRITVDGAPLAQRERTRLFLFHKPRGFVTTARDPEGRPTIFEALPDNLPRLVSIGRLDINTEGLLLLTNDGGLARVLELPDTGWLRRYRVRAHGHADPAALERLSEGVTIEGVEYRGIEARIERQQGDNVWIAMGLREGKNREIKRVLEHLGLAVNRLIRVSFGPFQLADIGEGQVEEVRTRVLMDQLGETLAKEAGADFEAPVHDHKNNMTGDGEIVSHRPAPRAPSRPPGAFKRTDDSRSGARAPSKSRDSGGKDRGGKVFGGKDRDSKDRAPRARQGTGRQDTGRPHSQDEQREHAPERPKDFRRKHISLLREESASDPRRLRTQSSEATDRRGREFKVERRMPAAGGKEAAAEKPFVRKGAANGERDARPGRAKPGFAKDRPQRAPRPFDRAERTGGEGRDFRKPRDGAKSASPARGRDSERPQRSSKSFGDKSFAGKPFSGKPRAARKDGKPATRRPPRPRGKTDE